MLRFAPEYIAPIRAGTKTQTRRRWPDGPKVQPGSIHAIRTDPDGSNLGHVHVRKVYQQLLSQLTEADARAEGFEDRAAFAAAWRKHYPDWSGRDEQVWVVEFWYQEV